MNDEELKKVWYVGFWVRGAAFLIDYIIVAFASIIVMIPINFVLGFVSSFLGPVGMVLQFIFSFLGLFIGWGYFIFMTHKYQATVGKMAIGMRVQSQNGDKLSLGDIVLRETIGKFVSGIIFGVGYIMIAFTDKKQGLHDFIAKSVVVYNDAKKGPNTAVVVITYIVYSIILFFGIMIMVIILAIFGFTTVNLSDNLSSTYNIVDKIENNYSHQTINNDLNTNLNTNLNINKS